MENKETNTNTPKTMENKFKNSKIVLTNQSILSLTGVSKIIQSTETVISVVLGGQNADITGSKLSVSKLDVENGILEANGLVTGIKFAGTKQKENFFKRIFK